MFIHAGTKATSPLEGLSHLRLQHSHSFLAAGGLVLILSGCSESSSVLPTGYGGADSAAELGGQGGQPNCVDLVTGNYIYCAPQDYAPVYVPPKQTEAERKQALLQAWKSVEPLPIDSRPLPPTWSAPFPLGAPGWKNSTQPLCLPFPALPTFSGFWADARGLFAAVARHCDLTLANATGCDGVEGSAIYQNTGTGWKVVALPATRIPSKIATFKEGGILFGTDILYDLDKGPSLLQHDMNPDFELGWLDAAGEHAVAILSPPFVFPAKGPKEFPVYELSGTEWSLKSTLGTTVFSGKLMPDNQLLLGSSNRIFGGVPSSLSLVENTPVGDYVGLWGVTASNFYAVNQLGDFLKYDGSYTKLATLPGVDTVKFEFADGRLYFASSGQFGYIQDDQVTTLAEFPDRSARIVHFAATDGLGAFLVLEDWTLRGYACGSYVVVWFDGSQFHRI